MLRYWVFTLLILLLACAAYLIPSRPSVETNTELDPVQTHVGSLEAQSTKRVVRQTQSLIGLGDAGLSVSEAAKAIPQAPPLDCALFGQLTYPSGLPAANLRIKAEFAHSSYTTTNELGEYRFEELVPGVAYILVTKPKDYREARVFAEAVQLLEGEEKRLDATVPELGDGSITGRFGMEEEAGNVALELTLFGSLDSTMPLARGFSSIRWKEQRRPSNIKGRETGYAKTFKFSGLPPDNYTLRVTLDPMNELWIPIVINLRDGEQIELGFHAFTTEEFLQAKLGYVPAWADAFRQQMKNLDDSSPIGEIGLEHSGTTTSAFND